jgi:TonB family protein
MMRPTAIAFVVATALAAAAGAVMSQSPPAPDAETVIRVSSTLFTPVAVRRVDPELPEAASRIGVAGPVLLEVRIDELGQVSDVLRVVRGHPTLHAAAERAVRQWTFEPHVFEGRAAPIVMTLVVPFAPPSSAQAGESQTTTRVLFPYGDRVGAGPVLLSLRAMASLPSDVVFLGGSLRTSADPLHSVLLVSRDAGQKWLEAGLRLDELEIGAFQTAGTDVVWALARNSKEGTEDPSRGVVSS